MNSLLIILLLGQHFLFDWILQPRWIAVNKSHNNFALFLHGVIVSVGFGATICWFTTLTIAVTLTILYGVLHIVQDKLVWGWWYLPVEDPYSQKSFWNTVAIDQFFHLALAVVLCTGFRILL
jgi:hypothetical protein